LLDDKNKEIFQLYWQSSDKLKHKNIYFIGRLAEYKYYNIDETVKRSLDLFNRIKNGRKE
jgi:UDP-galactopyranose mutase